MTQTIGAITPFHARAQRTLSNLELALVWMIAKGAIQRMGAERPRSQKAQSTAQISAARLPHCLHVLAQKMLSIRLVQLWSTILRNYRTGRSLAAASGNSHWPCSGRWPIQTSAAASGNSQRRCSERWHSVAPVGNQNDPRRLLTATYCQQIDLLLVGTLVVSHLVKTKFFIGIIHP